MSRSYAIGWFILLTVAAPAWASILGGNDWKVDLTKPDEAAAKVTWSTPEHLAVTDKGLGWDGQTNAMREGWIMSEPIGVGRSWRPATSVSVRVKITPAPATFTLPNGQQSTPYEGSVFVRHSADAQHWSDWQVLENVKPGERESAGRYFNGRVAVPEREREEYVQLMSKYLKLDVPWVSDEEAMAGWIVQQQPNFFRDHKPFVGYIQVLYEGGFYGQQRITGMDVSVGFGLSGIHQPPKDKNAYHDREGPWRFKTPSPTTQPSQ